MGAAAKSTGNAGETKPGEKPGDALDRAIGLAGPSFNFIVDNFMGLFTKLLKVELASALASVLMWLAAGLATAGMLALMGTPLLAGVPAAMAHIMSSNIYIAILVAWALFAILLISWLTETISLVSLPIVKGQFEGTYPGIWQTFGRIKFPVLGYVLLNFTICALFLGVPLILLFLLRGSEAVFIIGIVAYLIYAVLFILLYRFFAQFWLWEMLLGGRGAYESLSGSFSLVLGNVVGVFVFDIIRILASIAVGIPFFIVLLAVGFLFQLGMFATMLVSPLAYLGLLALSVVVRVAVTLIQSAATGSVTLPYTYSFWDAIRKKA